MATLLLLAAMAGFAAELPKGRIVAEVQCAANRGQSYALYLPSAYTPERAWPAIFAFDPGARGRVPVERYQEAAERYGYIVAGSNNSRNGPWENSNAAIQAMTADVGGRFRVDPRRVYTAGMSGGARLALGLALGSDKIAGVIASSAGFPDARPRSSAAFPIFGTAGSEDFNYCEMRRLDRELTSPHRVIIFEGGHIWLPAEVAMEAVEWLELQAMKSGRRPRDRDLADRIFARRMAGVDAGGNDHKTYLALQQIAADFDGLRDVSELAARAERLGRDKRVRDALKKERAEEEREQREINEILAAESGLEVQDRRSEALMQLRFRWKRLSAAANGPADNADRRIARRALRGLSMGVAGRVKDPEYLKIVQEFRPPRPAAQ